MPRIVRLAGLGALAAQLLSCLGVGEGATYAAVRTELAPADVGAVDALLASAGRDHAALAVVAAEDWSGNADAAIVVDAGRITRLRLRRAGLTSMATLAPLDALEELDLTDNAIPRIEGLAGARSLEVLALRQNHLSDLEGLDACPSLRWLYVDGNRVTSLAGLAPLPSLQDLSVNGNQLTTVDGLAGRTALTGLHLARNALTDLEGVHDLPALATLVVEGNRLRRLDGLRDLPALANVALADNLLSDASALAALPALRWVDLSRNPLAAIPKLGAEVKAEGTAAISRPEEPAEGAAPAMKPSLTTSPPADDAREGTSTTLPPASGSVRGGASSRAAGPGGAVASGSWRTLSGTSCPGFGKGVNVYSVRVTVKVAAGRVRVWLRDGQAYRWMLAEPGRPAELVGTPIERAGAPTSQPPYRVCIEALGGEASGVEYEVRST